MKSRSAAAKGVVPDWLFENAIFVRPTTAKESCFAILDKCSNVIISEDPAGYYSTAGGFLTEPWTLEIPDGRMFRVINCMVEVEFWRGWMIKFCGQEKRDWAIFRGDHMELCDGSKVPISEVYFHED